MTMIFDDNGYVDELYVVRYVADYHDVGGGGGERGGSGGIGVSGVGAVSGALPGKPSPRSYAAVASPSAGNKPAAGLATAGTLILPSPLKPPPAPFVPSRISPRHPPPHPLAFRRPFLRKSPPRPFPAPFCVPVLSTPIPTSTSSVPHPLLAVHCCLIPISTSSFPRALLPAHVPSRPLLSAFGLTSNYWAHDSRQAWPCQVEEVCPSLLARLSLPKASLHRLKGTCCVVLIVGRRIVFTHLRSCDIERKTTWTQFGSAAHYIAGYVFSWFYEEIECYPITQ